MPKHTLSETLGVSPLTLKLRAFMPYRFFLRWEIKTLTKAIRNQSLYGDVYTGGGNEMLRYRQKAQRFFIENLKEVQR